MWAMEEKKEGVQDRVKGRHSDLWFGSAINRSVRGTVVAIPCNKSDTVSNIPLIIPPCQGVATNMSDFNKHRVLERVIERQEKIVKRKKTGSSQRNRDKGNTKEKALKKSPVKFFFFGSHHIQ